VEVSYLFQFALQVPSERLSPFLCEIVIGELERDYVVPHLANKKRALSVKKDIIELHMKKEKSRSRFAQQK
jgi:hypothetical protein